MEFNNAGHYSPFNPADLHLHLRFQHEIQHLKIVFDGGRFQVFSAENLVAEFVDVEFLTINLLGLMIFGPLAVGANMDEFSISGPGIPDGAEKVAVRSLKKLATAWGGIKRGSLSF